MADSDRRGPEKGSPGAQRISAAHAGHHDHDTHGGFAANPELAKTAGKKGGDAVKKKYGSDFYKTIGELGGKVMKERYGREFYAKIGQAGGRMKSSKAQAANGESAE